MCLEQLVCTTPGEGGGGTDGIRLFFFFLRPFFSSLLSQQSTRRRLDLVKEFLPEKNKSTKIVLLQSFVFTEDCVQSQQTCNNIKFCLTDLIKHQFLHTHTFRY